MVLPLWRSLHSLNLMLPKEDRRAMLLRFFNDETPLINMTSKRERIEASTPPPEVEDTALAAENRYLGEDQQEHIDRRETWEKVGDEDDRFNTTV